LDWEEALLYAMASNGDYFGTGMMKFNEKQFYRKLLNVIKIKEVLGTHSYGLSRV
jgi:hypothetical protein